MTLRIEKRIDATLNITKSTGNHERIVFKETVLKLSYVVWVDPRVQSDQTRVWTRVNDIACCCVLKVHTVYSLLDLSSLNSLKGLFFLFYSILLLENLS
jgi:hypothetical protein